MDHIPKPLSPALPPIEVPYLGFQYDRLGFHGFLERNNLSTERVLKGDFGARTNMEAAGLLQAWLYFSSLDEIVSSGIECRPIRLGACSQVNPTDFLKESGDKCWISTVKLPALLHKWDQATSAMSQTVKRQPSQLVERNLQIMHMLATRRFHQKVGLSGMWPLDETAIFSILILFETLGAFALNVYQGHIDTALCLWPESALLTKRLRSAGWSDIDMKTWELGLCASYFLSSLHWPRLDEYGTQGDEVVSRGRETDPDRQQTRHTDSACDCGFLSLARAELASIVLQGRIPLVKVRLVCDSHRVRPSLEVRSWDIEKGEKISYVAISHVWIDGLGNQWDNALPQCQLLRLMQMVASICPEEVAPPYFWLHTLCIPSDEKVKKLALRTMKQVYERASKTLVLGASLMHTRWNWRLAKGRLRQSNRFYVRALELFARLTTSAWFQRLWTVQEAAYSKEIHVQLEDGTATPLLEATYILNAERPGREQRFIGFGTGILTIYLSVNNNIIHNRDRGDAECLERLCGVLQKRFTTNWEDEAICVATLLDLNVAVVQSFDPRDRIGAILKSFRQVPSSIVFSGGPRYSTDGMRWAPTSLLRALCYTGFGEELPKAGILSAKGLTIETLGMITRLDAWKKNIILLGQTEGLQPMWLCVVAYGSTEIFSEVWDQPARGEELLRSAEERDTVCDGVKREILSQLHDDCEELGFLLDPVFAYEVDLRDVTMRGLLVEIVERTPNDTVITGRVVSSVQVGATYQLDFPELNNQETYPVERSKPDQKWCLM